MLWNVLVFVALIYLDRRFTIGHGRLFALYVAGYCVGRFWVELLRDDPATHIAGVRINSFTSTFVFIGAVVYVMLAPRGREDPATLGGAGGPAVEEEPVPAPSGTNTDEPVEPSETTEDTEVPERAEADETEATDAAAAEPANDPPKTRPTKPKPRTPSPRSPKTGRKRAPAIAGRSGMLKG
ncbi:prolipodiacylglyceryl transferase family protein [Mycobacterium xenopi 4042]|uniref:Prolipodiacylglyceryl transferase family protein n=1 Tax=Mycobacterium xenopi 4042 TaxID=1299334 RepID=X7YQF9_MYCXE|nr:prolipodiacylglyceryl transferase family protein [Mycobacterium xenopi 4042]